MNRLILIILAMSFFPVALFAQVSTLDERDFGKSGAMSVAELYKESITFELDANHICVWGKIACAHCT